MEDNIFKFEDFLSEKKEKLKSIKQILESVNEVDSEEETDLSSPEYDITDVEEDLEGELNASEDSFDYTHMSEPSQELEDTEEVYQEDDLSEEETYQEEVTDVVPESEKFYNLYSDKSENFVCDIAIQGADPKQTQARLVVESGDWTLMFYGEVQNGKCTIPIKKLNILKEGQVGDIRLEVVAEGNLFVPWEDKFKVRVSKKVTVKVNEQKDYYTRPLKKNVGVKVKVKR